MSDGSGDEGVLDQALRALRQSWRATSDHWRDQARLDFDKEHLDGIEIAAREAARSLREIAALLSEVRRQCQ